MDRRKFLQSLAAAPLLAQAPAPPANVRIVTDRTDPSQPVTPSTGASGATDGSQTLLKPTDFTYLGRIGLPIEDGWSHSRGAMTGRIVNGVQRLFIGGAESNVERLFEVTLPEPTRAPAQFGRAQVVRAWGDVSRGGLLGEAPSVVKQYIRGVKWLESRQRLLWNYTLWYGSSRPPGNPSMGLSELRDDGTVIAYGPWRGDQAYDLCCGPVVDIPTWFQTKYKVGPLGVASPQFSQVSFLGANMHAFSVPEDKTRRDTPVDWSPSEQNSHVTIKLQRLLYHDMDHPQKKPVEPEGWFSCSGGASATSDEPIRLPALFGGGKAHAGETVDNWLTAVWIDTPMKQGVLYFGVQQRKGHNWYGNYPRTSPNQPPTGVCWHGHSAAFGGGIGMTATSAYLVGAIYDPRELGRVASGQAPSHAISPYAEFTADEFASNSKWVPKNAFESHLITGSVGASTYRFGGAHFEPRTGLLYVIENAAEYTNNALLSMVHVFRLNS
jgi:hypothetical protein